MCTIRLCRFTCDAVAIHGFSRPRSVCRWSISSSMDMANSIASLGGVLLVSTMVGRGVGVGPDAGPVLSMSWINESMDVGASVVFAWRRDAVEVEAARANAGSRAACRTSVLSKAGQRQRQRPS
ncbi:hypothetical protein BBAD15_g5340 [Beauveria bassiana D1-5]|uniref:Uncharacterized protein n=1 Tax=Beauveria bassiana D1-5 TaxID=1245745 RepID=A0A0A2VN58_BEABA|nr:hypothetical protein BBAD15_g5340 [Beauveria bassiana D1-5]